jgi:hypothetical protein
MPGAFKLKKGLSGREILARCDRKKKGEHRGMSDSTKQKTVITAATFQRTTMRPGPNAIVAWCDQCAAEVLMLSPTHAAALAHTTTRDIYRRVESGAIHFSETEDGVLLVCAVSLQGSQYPDVSG